MSLSGRRAQAARNDQLVLDAARAVFTADPGAPIAAVAERAGVGISVLYRRYRSKDELLQRLSLDGLQRYGAAAEAALADEGDAWEAFTAYMRRSVAEGAGSLSVRFAGNFTATDELYRLGRKANEVTQKLLDRTKAAGAVRRDIEVADLSLLFEQLQAIRAGDDERNSQLRQRYLTLILDALHEQSGTPLPGPPPTQDELGRRYGS
ncbi:MAG TPA: helix-turn-helix domain-containing protein [Ktedonobacterales bacterium]|nr:helix-turn-helix domain-containing protein [Ktedonobacterales bacterium]